MTNLDGRGRGGVGGVSVELSILFYEKVPRSAIIADSTNLWRRGGTFAADDYIILRLLFPPLNTVDVFSP